MEHGATAWHISISITGRSIGKADMILSVAQERPNTDITAMFRREKRCHRDEKFPW